jgi:signal transduction histidine kinase
MRPGTPQRGEPPSVGMAMARFAAGGLLAVLVLGTISIVALARIGRAEAIRDAKELTQVVGTSVVQPALSDALLRGDPAARAQLDRVVRRRVLSGDFTRVKIWSPGGRILYSDRPELVGQRYELGSDDLEIFSSGGVDAGISDLTRPENRFERDFGKLLEVYMPLRTPGGKPVLFETYLRFSEVAASGRDLWWRFVPALIGALLVLELVQLPLARSLARRLERTHAEREAALQAAVDASELERRRIAADLHDGTVQELVAASYRLAAARERAEPGSDSAAALAGAEETTRTAVRELRSLLIDIYPPRLREAGLADALEGLVRPLEQRGIAASVDAPRDLELPYETTELLYRTAREAVRNVAEHAAAGEVRMVVSRADGHVVLTVDDDGRGFSPEAALARPAEGHFGLRLLADRVQDGGGTFEVDSAPGRGTRLRVEVPASCAARRSASCSSTTTRSCARASRSCSRRRTTSTWSAPHPTARRRSSSCRSSRRTSCSWTCRCRASAESRRYGRSVHARRRRRSSR